VTFDEEKPRSS
ncbi:hypothetical protein Tco_0225081, partial [Tanacetum coccineum]